jgi:hypothetical protein
LVVGGVARLAVILAFDVEALDVVLELDLTSLIVPELKAEIALFIKMKMSLTFF